MRAKFRLAVDDVLKVHDYIRQSPFAHTESNRHDFRMPHSHKPCIIRGGLGKGIPMINESEIWFNGDIESNMDAETFSIQWYPTSEDKGIRETCMTEQKPYDVLVCIALLALNAAFNDPQVFVSESDGASDDWQCSNTLYQRIYAGTLNLTPQHIEILKI